MSKKKEKPAWALKHRKTKKISYWYIDYRDGLVSLILGLSGIGMSPDAGILSVWQVTVDMLNTYKVEATADLSAYGIK
jgi:hypothetical protein